MSEVLSTSSGKCRRGSMMMVKWLGMCLLLLPVLCVSHSSQQLPQHSPPPSYGIDEREGSKAFFNYHAGMTTPENEPIAGVGLAPNSAADRQGTAYFQRFDSEDPKARSSTSGSSSTTNSKSNVGYDEDGNTFLSGNAESGYKSEFVVGKDRELLHVSIDLKWLYRTIVNPQHWKGIARFCKDRIKRLHMGYNQLMRYREQAGNLLVSIRALEPDSCNLRLLQCSLEDASALLLKRQRFLVFYIEEDLAVDMTPSMETLLFRRAFAGSHYLRSSNIEFDELEGRNNEIANLINEQFFMMACFHDHAYAKAVRSLVRNHIQQLTTSLPSASLLMDEESYPMLVVLAPSEEDYEAYAQHQAALVSFEYDTKRLEQQVETDAINNTPNNLQDKKLRKKLEKEKRKIRNRKKPVLTLPSMLSKKKGGDSLEVLGVMKIPTELIVFATEGADDLDFSESTFADENDINATKHREKLIRTRLKERLAICEENVSKSVLQFLQQVLQEHTDRLQLLPQYVERAHIEEAERQASQDAMMESEEGAAVDVELLEYQQYPGQIDHSIDTTTSLSSQDIDANAAVEEREGIESTQKS